MARDKSGIVILCTIYDKTFDAGHVSHNRISIVNRFANHFRQQVRSRYGGCANDHHIGVRENFIKIQGKLIDQPQRSPLLQRGRSRTPPQNLPAPTCSFERSCQRPRDQPKPQKSDCPVVNRGRIQIGARGYEPSFLSMMECSSISAITSAITGSTR